MSLETIGRASSGASGAAVRAVFGLAMLLASLVAAAGIGGGGQAVAIVCIGGGFGLAPCLPMLAHLPPIGRLFCIIVAAMALLVAVASVVNLEQAGW